MTRTIILLGVGCFLVVGAAAASILVRNGVPAIEVEAASPAVAAAKSPLYAPVSNKESKKDRLAVAALASADPQQIFPSAGNPVRQAFASEGPVDAVSAPEITAPAAIQKPKLAAKPADVKPADVKPPVQKNYTLLSDAQIAAIKGRLNLSSNQESYWPAVEDALRKVARKIHEQRQAKSNASGPPIDPESAEVQQLKSAAMPLLFQLREDQKREVRALARIIGLEAVASAI